MLGINFLFILRKSVNFSVILSSKRKMNWTIDVSDVNKTMKDKTETSTTFSGHSVRGL